MFTLKSIAFACAVSVVLPSALWAADNEPGNTQAGDSVQTPNQKAFEVQVGNTRAIVVVPAKNDAGEAMPGANTPMHSTFRFAPIRVSGPIEQLLLNAERKAASEMTAQGFQVVPVGESAKSYPRPLWTAILPTFSGSYQAFLDQSKSNATGGTGAARLLAGAAWVVNAIAAANGHGILNSVSANNALGEAAFRNASASGALFRQIDVSGQQQDIKMTSSFSMQVLYGGGNDQNTKVAFQRATFDAIVLSSESKIDPQEAGEALGMAYAKAMGSMFVPNGDSKALSRGWFD